jgi:hypothetical protein
MKLNLQDEGAEASIDETQATRSVKEYIIQEIDSEIESIRAGG